MDFRISGEVVHGDSYGKKIGFPTVNLAVDVNMEELPKSGVYAGKGFLENKEYKAGIVLGPNDKIEAHMIGFNGDAYGKKVTLVLNKFLREYKKFDTEEELIGQIKKDLNKC
jgi:FAD synthase